MDSRPILRIAPWVILVAVAYVGGRWHAGASKAGSKPSDVAAETPATSPAPPPSEAVEPASPEAPPPATTARTRDDLMAETAALAEAARTMAVPDARTYAFFENLTAAELDPVVAWIEAMPPGNEQDVMFIMAVRRWAALDGPTAVARADRFPALGTRTNARFAAYEAWGASDAAAAFAQAIAITDSEEQGRLVSSVLTGAATADPKAAIDLWLSAPEAFRTSAGGTVAAGQIASGAYGTGKGQLVRELVAGLEEGPLRKQLIETLATEWGSHYPDDALAWVQQSVTDNEARETAVNGIFSSLVQKDPALAAVWSAEYPDQSRRTSYIAAAVQSWARLDAAAAETWVNEQPSGAYLDGAGYAMAAHYMTRRDMSRSFSWIRRINMVEMRAELLGALGRMWSTEQPAEFKKFLDETSLNRAEVEMLLAKIPPAS